MPVSNSHQGFVVGDGKHPGTCQKCGATFEGIRPGMTLCISCWYAGEETSALERFAPLDAALKAAGMRTELQQTGGMVMCLAAYPTDEEFPYFMWGDPEDYEHPLGFCVYVRDRDDTMQDLVVNFPRQNYEALTDMLRQRWQFLVQIADTNVTELDVTSGGAPFSVRNADL